MRRTEVLQGIREMKFEEIRDRFVGGRLSSAEAAEWLGVMERTFRREKHGLTASYGRTKSVLQAWGLARPAARRSAHRKKRARKPVPGMMLRQDGSRR